MRPSKWLYCLSALLGLSIASASPSYPGGSYDPPIEFTTPSPGFDQFSPLPYSTLDSGNDCRFGIWDNDSNAYILDPVHPHEAGLPYPTARSRECASVKDLVREGVVGREALLPYIHESLHESIAPSISAPSVNNQWYEQQYREGADEQYEDAEDGEEVNQSINQGNQGVYTGLGDLTEGGMYGQGVTAGRSSFHHEQDYGGLLDALPSKYVEEDDSGRRSSVHFEDYGGLNFDHSSYPQPQGSVPYQSPAIDATYQQQFTQDLFNSFGQSSLPPRPPASHSTPRTSRPRNNIHTRTAECLNDIQSMRAWETYKMIMNAPASQPDPDDSLWKRFMKKKTPTIINDLNSGNPDRINQAKLELSTPMNQKHKPKLGFADPSTWSTWAQTNYNEVEFQRLTLKCCQLCQVTIEDQSARTHWMNRLLTQSNDRIISALRSGQMEQQMWAMGQLAGQTTAAMEERRQRQQAAALATSSLRGAGRRG